MDPADVAECIHERLHERLESAFRGVDRKRVVVLFRTRASLTSTAIGSTTGLREDLAAWKFPAGCLTKLFTGALIHRAIRNGDLRLDALAADVLPRVKNIEAVLDATIKDLLNHTHGLDDSGVKQAPLDATGCIHVTALLAALVPRRLAQPGEIYSYSNVGSWLLAAVLERLYGRRFEAQLRADLLEPLGVHVHLGTSVPASPATDVCASMGGALAISARDMLAFLESETSLNSEAWTSVASETTPLPGWNAFELGILRGWKSHGDHWFGHNAVGPPVSSMVRVQPELGVVIVVASTHHPAPLVAAKLFGELLPEYKRRDFPRLLANGVERLDLTTHCGRYGSKAYTLVVSTAADRSALRLTAPGGIDAALLPASGGLFLVRPCTRSHLSFVQFLGSGDSEYRYLWDGRRVYRRLS